MAALATKKDAIRLDDDEALKLAKALKELQKYYPSVDLPGVVLAWVNLGTAVVQVYGTRIGAAVMDAKAANGRPQPVPLQRAGVQ